MSYGYGGRPNPFDQRDDSTDGGYGAPQRPPQGSYGQGPRPGGGGAPPRYNQGPSMGRDEYSSGNVEMTSLTQNAGAFANGNGNGNSDPNAVLNECRSIDQGINQIDQNLTQLRMLQDRSLGEADTSGSATSRQLDALSAETMALYRELTDRVRRLKSSADARQPKNQPQVKRIDARLKQAINAFQQQESGFRKKTQDQMARQYRIVRPDASEQEVRAVVEDNGAGGGQVFQQAMMQSDRRGQARAVLSAVQDRHAALQRIEQQMIELAQLFQDMDTLVVQQEAAVVQIEQKGEEVVENLDKGNEEITVAVETAKKTRKKKWICLGICVAIVVIIVVIVVAYMLINKKPAESAPKRRSFDELDARSSVEWSHGSDAVPVARHHRLSSRYVIPAGGFDGHTDEDSLVAKFGRIAGVPTRIHVGKRYIRVGVPYVPDEPEVSEEGEKEKRFVPPGGVFHESEEQEENVGEILGQLSSGKKARRFVVPGAVFHEPEPQPEEDGAGERKGRRYVVPGASFREDPEEQQDEKRYVVAGEPWGGEEEEEETV